MYFETKKKSVLLPCPFCGGTDLRYDGYWCYDFNGFYVRCLNCNASATPKGTKRAAREAWNTRITQEKMKEILDKYLKINEGVTKCHTTRLCK